MPSTSQRDINRRVQRFKKNANNERPESPYIIQTTSSRKNAASEVIRMAAASGDSVIIGDNRMSVNLFKNGIEQTEGDESNVIVHCTVVGATALADCIPFLHTGDKVYVMKIPYYYNGDIADRWVCISPIFQAVNTAQFNTGLSAAKLDLNLGTCE